MGGLSRGRDRDHSRGQLLLAGAFILAVALIGLTLVFSASNYTAALASDDGSVSQGDDAVDLRETVRASVASYLPVENAKQTPSSANFSSVVASLSEGVQDHFAQRGQYVTLAPGVVQEGQRINQSSLREPSSADQEWIVEDDTRVRNMTVKLTAVPSTADENFKIVFDTSTTEWRVEVFGAGSSTLRVLVRRGTGSPWAFESSCDIGYNQMSPNVYLNVSDATVITSAERKHCSALEALDPADPYDVEFDFGSASAGDFWFIKEGTTPADPAKYTGLRDLPSEIYSVTVGYRYESPSVSYNTNIRIAPGEI